MFSFSPRRSVGKHNQKDFVNESRFELRRKCVRYWDLPDAGLCFRVGNAVGAAFDIFINAQEARRKIKVFDEERGTLPRAYSGAEERLYPQAAAVVLGGIV